MGTPPNFLYFLLVRAKACAQAIEELVERNPHAKFDRSFLTLTPNESMEEFWLPLRAFDYSEKGKNGCAGFGEIPKICFANGIGVSLSSFEALTFSMTLRPCRFSFEHADADSLS